MYKMRGTSLRFPANTLRNVQLINPKEIPMDKLYVNGIRTSVKKQGIAISWFRQSISRSGASM